MAAGLHRTDLPTLITNWTVAIQRCQGDKNRIARFVQETLQANGMTPGRYRENGHAIVFSVGRISDNQKAICEGLEIAMTRSLTGGEFIRVSILTEKEEGCCEKIALYGCILTVAAAIGTLAGILASAND